MREGTDERGREENCRANRFYRGVALINLDVSVMQEIWLPLIGRTKEEIVTGEVLIVITEVLPYLFNLFFFSCLSSCSFVING
jgi:hypothetical protein